MTNLIAENYPWLQPLWHRLSEQHRLHRLPHAMIFVQAKDVGQTTLIQSFAQALLCQQAHASQACGNCAACRLCDAGTHPDFLSLATSAEHKTIKVEAVRTLNQTLAQHPHQAQWRIIHVTDAQAMSVAAVNALLKTLEAPPPQTLFMLQAAQPGQLLPTLLSRCQLVSVPGPDLTQSVQWLTSQGVAQADAEFALFCALHSPRTALSIAQSEQLQKQRALLNTLLNALTPNAAFLDLSRYTLHELTPLVTHLLYQLMPTAIDASYKPADLPLPSISVPTLTPSKLYKVYDFLLDLERARAQGITLSESLALDKLALLWQQCAEQT